MPKKLQRTGFHRSARRQGDEDRFAEVIALIDAARRRAYQSVNVELVRLYWDLGQIISAKIASAEWRRSRRRAGGSLDRRFPGMRGFTRRNLFRMRQFFEAYRTDKRVSPVVTQLPWTHHLIILSQVRSVEAREFYVLAAIKERWLARRRK